MVEMKVARQPTHPVLEKDFQRKVIARMKKEFPNIWFYKASDRFLTGIPDIVGCKNGQMFGIELKVGNNKPTQLQEYTMSQMRCAGAKVLWSRDLDEIMEFLKEV